MIIAQSCARLSYIPPPDDITRRTVPLCYVITHLKDLGYKVTERKLAIDEVYTAAEAGTLGEIFATGTAAVISPIGLLSYKGKEINNNEVCAPEQRLYDTIYGIQTGTAKDPTTGA